MRKKDYEREVSRLVGRLAGRKNHSDKELTEIGMKTPVRVMKDARMFADYVDAKGLGLGDVTAILAWMFNMREFLHDVSVDTDISFVDTARLFEQARVNMIVIHRLNHILHESMIHVYDILERDNLVRFAVKKALNETEKPWNVYSNDRRKVIEKTAWYTMQDHLRLTDDAISPYREKVYEVLRDYMIHLGYRDVELMARCEVVFLVGKVMGHSFHAFFEKFRRESGLDFSVCFEDDNLYGMVGRFADLCKALGMTTEKDAHGFYMLKGFNPEDNGRFNKAWGDFICALRDDDLMDRTAQQAIGLNPSVKNEYEKILAVEVEKDLDDSIGQLSDKYKVSRL